MFAVQARKTSKSIELRSLVFSELSSGLNDTNFYVTLQNECAAKKNCIEYKKSYNVQKAGV